MDTSCSGGWGSEASQRPPGAVGFIDAAAPGRNRGLTSEGHRVPSPSWLCRELETAGCPSVEAERSLLGATAASRQRSSDSGRPQAEVAPLEAW